MLISGGRPARGSGGGFATLHAKVHERKQQQQQASKPKRKASEAAFSEHWPHPFKMADPCAASAAPLTPLEALSSTVAANHATAMAAIAANHATAMAAIAAAGAAIATNVNLADKLAIGLVKVAKEVTSMGVALWGGSYGK